MADFEITSPDGKKFIVSAPEGATQEQVLAFAQQSFSKQPAAPDVVSEALKSRGLAPAPKALTDFGKVGVNPAQSIGKMAYEAGGAATDAAAAAGLPPEVSGAIGVIPNLAVEGAAGLTVGGFSQKPIQGAAKWLMQSSIKPDRIARESGEAAKTVETMLTHRGTSRLAPGIAATEGGLERAQNIVSNLETKIQGVLQSAPETVDKGMIATRLEKAFSDVRYNAARAENVEDLKKISEQFWNHPEIKGMDVPVSVMNKMKQAWYGELTGRVKAYQPGAKMTAYDEGQKQLTRGMREEIAQAKPEIAPSLKEQSDLIRVLTVAGPQVAREGNKNIVGLGWLSPTSAQAVGWMLDRYPWFKSFLARTLNAGSVTLPSGVTIALTGAEQQTK